MCSWQLAPGTNTDVYFNDYMYVLLVLLVASQLLVSHFFIFFDNNNK